MFCTVILLLATTDIQSEFYEYIDENGVRTFTDDPGIIPESKIEETQVHKEIYEDLPAEERQKRLEADQNEIMAIQREREEERLRRERMRLIKQLEDEDALRKKKKEESKTPVRISNNQVLVPVTIGYMDNTVSITLLLDTGANITTINHDIAERLQLDNGVNSLAQVANGGIVETSISEVEFIKVGPKSISEPRIAVVPYVGNQRNFDGLLGMDFLKHFGYDIDFANGQIVWKE